MTQFSKKTVAVYTIDVGLIDGFGPLEPIERGSREWLLVEQASMRTDWTWIHKGLIPQFSDDGRLGLLPYYIAKTSNNGETAVVTSQWIPGLPRPQQGIKVMGWPVPEADMYGELPEDIDDYQDEDEEDE